MPAPAALPRRLVVALLALGCAPRPAPRALSATGSATAGPRRPARPSSCPSRPRMEWYALPVAAAPDGPSPVDGGPADSLPLGAPLGTPLGIGGHVLTIDLDPFAGSQSLLGTLLPKGVERLEAATLGLARAAARAQDGLPRRMGVALDGRVVAALEVTSMIRGRHFRVPTVEGWPPPEAPLEAAAARLRQAAADDRACFGGRDADPEDP